MLMLPVYPHKPVKVTVKNRPREKSEHCFCRQLNEYIVHKSEHGFCGQLIEYIVHKLNGKCRYDESGNRIDILGQPSYSTLHDEYCDIYFLETGQKLRELQLNRIKYYMLYDVPNIDEAIF